MYEKAFVSTSHRFYGKWCVVYPDGQREDCHNLATCLSVCKRFNEELMKLNHGLAKKRITCK